MKKLYPIAAKFAVSFRDFLFGFLGLLCVVMAIVMAIAERLPAAGLLFTAGLFLSVFASLSRFEFIKGLGVEAKMREIDEKVDHVERLAEKVAKTSTVTAEFCMEVMARIGRVSGPIPRATALRLVRGMSSQLLSLNVEQGKIDVLLDSWRKMVTFDLLHPARKAVQDAMFRIQQDLDQIVKGLPSPINTNSPEYLDYLQRREEVDAWRKRVQLIWKGNTIDDIRLLEDIYKGLIEQYGKSVVTDAEAAEKSMRHGAHFAEHHDFLDEGYWTDGDRK